jgi:hypothetical protein
MENVIARLEIIEKSYGELLINVGSTARDYEALLLKVQII